MPILLFVALALCATSLARVRSVDSLEQNGVPQVHVPLQPPTPGRDFSHKTYPMVYLSRPGKEKWMGEMKQQTVELLERCGFDVRPLDIPSDGNVSAKISELNFPPDTPVIIDAVHGEMSGAQGETSQATIGEHIPMSYKFDGNVPAGQVFRSVRNVLGASSIFNESCFGDGCRQEAQGKIGTASRMSETTNIGPQTVWGQPLATSPIMREVINLYCDSINRCAKFGAGSQDPDIDGDGRLSGDEINTYLNTLGSGEAVPLRDQSGDYRIDQKKELLATAAKCGPQAKISLVQSAKVGLRSIDPKGKKHSDTAGIYLTQSWSFTKGIVLPESLEIPASAKDLPAEDKETAVKSFITNVIDPGNGTLTQDETSGTWSYESLYDETKGKHQIELVDSVFADKSSPPYYSLTCVSDVKMKPHTVFQEKVGVRSQVPYFDPSFEITCRNDKSKTR